MKTVLPAVTPASLAGGCTPFSGIYPREEILGCTVRRGKLDVHRHSGVVERRGEWGVGGAFRNLPLVRSEVDENVQRRDIRREVSGNSALSKRITAFRIRVSRPSSLRRGVFVESCMRDADATFAMLLNIPM